MQQDDSIDSAGRTRVRRQSIVFIAICIFCQDFFMDWPESFCFAQAALAVCGPTTRVPHLGHPRRWHPCRQLLEPLQGGELEPGRAIQPGPSDGVEEIAPLVCPGAQPACLRLPLPGLGKLGRGAVVDRRSPSLQCAALPLCMGLVDLGLSTPMPGRHGGIPLNGGDREPFSPVFGSSELSAASGTRPSFPHHCYSHPEPL